MRFINDGGQLRLIASGKEFLLGLCVAAIMALGAGPAMAAEFVQCGSPILICQGSDCPKPPNTNETFSVPDLKTGDEVKFNVERGPSTEAGGIDTLDTQCSLQFDQAGGSISLDPKSLLTSDLAPGGTDAASAKFTAQEAGVGKINVGPPTRGTVLCPNGNITTSFTVTPFCKIAPVVKKLTLVKSTTTPSFQAVGETISYEYLVTNEGNVTLTNLSVSDDKTTVSCPVSELAPGASTTCTADYSVKQADIEAGKVTNTATATAKYGSDTVDSEPSSVTVHYVPATEPKIDLEKSASVETYTHVGQVVVYSYVVRNIGNALLEPVTVTDDKLGPICEIAKLNPGASQSCTKSYTIVLADLSNGFITNVGTATGTDPKGGTVTDTDDLTIRFDKNVHEEKTKVVVRNFLNRRVDLLASNEPDRARMLRRFRRTPAPGPGSLKDGPMKLRGSVTGAGNGRFSFATSLSQARAHAAASRAHKLAEGTKSGLGLSTQRPVAVAPSSFDFWVEGHFQRWSDDVANADRSGNFGILYVGADYLVQPWLLVGALAQFDTMMDNSDKTSAKVSGKGWMVGPYVGVKLSENVLFDARAAWGQSDNTVNPFGYYSNKFETERWLAKASLTGNWHHGRWRFTPSVGVIYVAEEQQAYVDSLGVSISSQTSKIGRLTFGPEFGYKFRHDDGTTIEPHVSIKGMWDFDKTAYKSAVQGLLVSDDDFRVKIEGGLLFKAPNGLAFRATVSHDGLGTADFSAWGGQLWLNMPFN